MQKTLPIWGRSFPSEIDSLRTERDPAYWNSAFENYISRPTIFPCVPDIRYFNLSYEGRGSMDQLRDLADDRLFRGCAYCGASPDTRDHVPSKIFLDEPFPSELPVIGACKECNNGFSKDEEYVACLVECAFMGTVDPGYHRREKIAKILRRSQGLRAELAAARICTYDQTSFSVDAGRVENVLLKLAKGHAMFELSWFSDHEPVSLWWSPLASLTEDQRGAFEETPSPQLLGEIGSRATQRMMVLQAKLLGPDGHEYFANLLISDWIDVQEERYRYLVSDQDRLVRVRMVVGEYLACEVIWAQQ